MASAQQMKEYAEVGKGFGLKDAELQTFVMSQVKAAQEAARLEREATQIAASDERAAERNRRDHKLRNGEYELISGLNPI